MSSLTVEFFFFGGFVSAGLSFGIAYLMLASFRTIRSEYLLGFPIGFTLLGFSNAFFGLAYLMPFLEGVTSWFYLLLDCYGFAFLAFTYFFRKSSFTSATRGPRRWYFLLALSAAVVVVAVLLSTSLLPEFQEVDGFFRVVNLVFIGYMIYCLNRALKAEAELSSVVLGFTFLAIEQYSLLLWVLDRGFDWAFLFAQLVRIAGLAILVAFIIREFGRA